MSQFWQGVLFAWYIVPLALAITIWWILVLHDVMVSDLDEFFHKDNVQAMAGSLAICIVPVLNVIAVCVGAHIIWTEGLWPFIRKRL